MTVIGAGARGKFLTDVDAPHLAPGGGIDANKRAIARRGIDGIRRDRGRETGRGLADVDLPIELRRNFGRQRRQWAGLVALAEQPAERRRRDFRQYIG